VGLNVLFTLVRSFSFAYGGLNAAKSLYCQLTTSTLHTYLHFFEVQSLGRLLNRFGKDTDCIDEDLPFMLNIVLAQVSGWSLVCACAVHVSCVSLCVFS
jgi:ATP-binding cassette, subfamily C (CFTR/MRP), member 10